MTLDDLRKIAEAATKGPWEYRGDYFGVRQVPTDQHLVGPNKYEMEGIVPGEYIRAEDAEFIATFNPQKVLELLDQIEAQNLNCQTDACGECGACKRAGIKDQYTMMDREIHQLRARLAAVEKLHEREEIDYCDDPECCDLTPTCTDCAVNWPCPTIRAIKETQND